MCEPLTALSIVTGLAGTGVQAYGGLVQADAAEAEGIYRERMANENARLSRFAAVDARDRGAQAEGRARMAGTLEIGAQRAAYGASGVDGSVGSPLQAMADTRLVSELDVRTLRNNAAREAFGYRMQANQQEEEGRFARRRAGSEATGHRLGAAGVLLGGIGNSLGSAARASGGK